MTAGAFPGYSNDDRFCMDNLAFIIALVVIVTALITSAGLTTVVTNKLIKRTDQLQKLTSDLETPKTEVPRPALNKR